MKLQGITIAERIEATKGKTSGFDYLRIVLAFLVILSHTFTVSLESEARDAFVHSLYYRPFLVVLPMFFALSGFLVAGSLERCSGFKEFYGLRILRIVPALAVETFISALILGPLLTNLSLDTYIEDPLFYHYFFNIVGHIQYALPGVFSNNPIPNIVNSQLWTIPYELYCYIAIGIIGISGLFVRRYTLLGATAFLSGLILVGIYFGYSSAFGLELVLDFVLGIGIYKFRDILPWNSKVAIALALLILVLLQFKGGIHLCIIPLAYLTVYIGLTDPPRNEVMLSGDYSYGIYLYGFVIQQAVASLGPWAHQWWINGMISIPCAVACAVLSWWYVEKPALKLRRYLRPQSRPVQCPA